MSDQQIQELEKQLLPKVRIFVDNDALAFFDVKNPPSEPTYVADIKDRPMKIRYFKPYNFLVEFDKTHYFRVGEIENSVGTISITTSCIVFAAFTTDDNGKVKSSGVYHAVRKVPFEGYKERLYKLIDTVRLEPDDIVTFKAAGSDDDEEYCQRIRKYLTEISSEKGVKIKPEYLIIGGSWDRITEFYPKTGQLVTYFSNSEQKTII